MANGSKTHLPTRRHTPLTSPKPAWLPALIAAGAFVCALASSPAQAGQSSASKCNAFCTEMDSHQLETYRAEGADGASPSGLLHLSVILWDENRRVTPPPTSGSSGSTPAGTSLTITPPNAGVTNVPALLH
jgi:hypothetical protein